MRMDSVEHYERYQLLIISRASSFHHTTGHDLEDLISQGNLIYTKVLATFDPSRAKFSTLLYSRLNHGLSKYTKRHARHRKPFLELSETSQAIPPTQHRSHLFYHHLSLLKKEAREVIELIINAPLELFTQTRKQHDWKYSQSAILKHLRKKGLSEARTRKIYVQIRELAYNNMETECSLSSYRKPAEEGN